MPAYSSRPVFDLSKKMLFLAASKVMNAFDVDGCVVLPTCLQKSPLEMKLKSQPNREQWILKTRNDSSIELVAAIGVGIQ